jgi:hypothetical protein
VITTFYYYSLSTRGSDRDKVFLNEKIPIAGPILFVLLTDYSSLLLHVEMRGDGRRASARYDGAGFNKIQVFR